MRCILILFIAFLFYGCSKTSKTLSIEGVYVPFSAGQGHEKIVFSQDGRYQQLYFKDGKSYNGEGSWRLLSNHEIELSNYKNIPRLLTDLAAGAFKESEFFEMLNMEKSTTEIFYIPYRGELWITKDIPYYKKIKK